MDGFKIGDVVITPDGFEGIVEAVWGIGEGTIPDNDGPTIRARMFDGWNQVRSFLPTELEKISREQKIQNLKASYGALIVEA